MWGALSDERTVCPLQLLLALARTVIFRFESRVTRDHILLSQIRDYLSVASHDSQDYGGGVLPLLHTGVGVLRFKVTSRVTVSQSWGS
jgi:hypothetical protein